MCHRWVVHMKVQVNLLRIAVRPVRRQMVRRQLYPDYPSTFGVKDIVEVVVGEHSTVEHFGPEGTLRTEIACIEDDDSSHDSQVAILPDPRCAVSQNARAPRSVMQGPTGHVGLGGIYGFWFVWLRIASSGRGRRGSGLT